MQLSVTTVRMPAHQVEQYPDQDGQEAAEAPGDDAEVKREGKISVIT